MANDRYGPDKDHWWLQVCLTDWVVWGYHRSNQIIERKLVKFYPFDGNRDFCIEFTFNLESEVDANLPPPQVFEERRCWAWRFQHSAAPNLRWTFADSYEACLEAARVRAPEFSRSDPEAFIGALDDIEVLEE